MKLVIHPPVDPERLDKILTEAGEMQVVNAQRETEVLEEIGEADAFFGKITLPMLAAAQKLSWVQAPTASLEHYIFPELVRHACVLTNMRGLFSDVIADHVFGYIICFARNFHVYIRNQLEACWEAVGSEDARSSFAVGGGRVSAIERAHLHLADRTVGIVGLGNIGLEIARRALSFDMQVVAIDPLRTVAPKGVRAIWKPNRLPDLLSKSDFVVISAPHTPETFKLFCREQFQQMKRTAYLINIGRGVVVDLTDLTTALKKGEIAGAGLDVFEIEPLPRDHPLWRMENVIITPHVAGNSLRIAERHLGLLLENLHRFVQGKTLRNVVNKAKWY